MLTIKNDCVSVSKVCRHLLLPLIAISLVGLSACGGGGTGLEGTTSLLGSGGDDDQQADPVAVDLPIAYVRRTLAINTDNDPVQSDVLIPRAFNGGARLFIRDRAANSAAETDITSSLFDAGALYDVKDLSPSLDGTKLAFAMRAPLIEGVDEDDPSQPTWNIWEYNLSSKTLRRIITNSALAEGGHDISPHYLPGDQRIVFSSTRQAGSQNIQTNEGIFINSGVFSALTDRRDEDIGEAFVLHTMNADPELILNNGQEIRQITYNQSHDLQPTVLRSGKIAFLRWDAAENRDQLSLYTVKPDGSEMNFLYGYHIQNPIDTGAGVQEATFFDLAELPDNRLFAVLKHRNNGEGNNNFPILGGDLLAINSESFSETNQPVDGGQNSISPLPITLDETISTSGYYNSAFPLDDGTDRFLVTWSPCRLNDATETTILLCTENNLELTGVTEADPFYGLWIFNPSTQTQQPIVVPAAEGEMFTDIVAIAPRTQPPILTELNDSSGYGTLNIRSIYDFSGVADNTPNGADIATVADPSQAEFTARRARFLRVVKAVSMPDDDVRDFDNDAFGVSQARSMRQILGYTPIEPDGSVKVQIPSDVAFHIEIVDGQGQRLPQFQLHRNWMQLASGEQRNCTGCHTSASELPHGRPDFEAVSAHNGAPNATVPYPNTSALLPADEAGETMAEIESRISSRTRTLVPDLLYTDVWTGAAFTPEADTELRYAEDGFVSGDATRVAAPPTNDACLSNWQAECRIIINYEDHIQPLWEADRFAIAGDTSSANRPCVLCHTAAGNTQTAAGQLELTTAPAGAFYVRSYTELLQADAAAVVNPLVFVLRDETRIDLEDQNIPQTPGDISDDTPVTTIVADVQQFLISDDNGTPNDSRDDTFVNDEVNADGTTAFNIIINEGQPDEEVIDRIPLVETALNNQEPNLRQLRYNNNGIVYYQQDDPDNPGTLINILDSSNNPIPVTDPLTAVAGQNIGARMAASSSANSRFFDVMDNSVSGSVDHSLFMTADELRLISEWLDIGAQYYNNPFDAPLN